MINYRISEPHMAFTKPASLTSRPDVQECSDNHDQCPFQTKGPSKKNANEDSSAIVCSSCRSTKDQKAKPLHLTEAAIENRSDCPLSLDLFQSAERVGHYRLSLVYSISQGSCNATV